MGFMQTEWTPQNGKIPAFSSRQPFAQALALGKKTIELKTWSTSYRGFIAIHASKLWYGDDGGGPNWRTIGDAARRMQLPKMSSTYPLQAIIAVARLVKCAKFTKEGYERLRECHQSNATWEPNEYGWLFEDVMILPDPIMGVRGYPGLFPVEANILDIVKVNT